ncbi:response regulator [Verrucomicrobiota bacterium]
MKILVLDDNKELLEVVANILVNHNYDVDCAENAQDAITMLRNKHYDFVLVDYKMPKNDGVWFMNNAELSPDTKVLLVTAHADKSMISKMFALGVSGYIVKPFDEEDLLRHLSYYSGK